MALGKTRKELLESLDIYELEEWKVFHAIEGGFGDAKQDYRAGQICSILANVNRNAKTTPTPFSADDFAMRPKLVEEKNDKDSVKEFKRTMDAIATPKKEGKK